MRLLVTGATGFVGRRLTAAACARWPYAEVTAFGGPAEDGGLDVTDAGAVREAVARARPTHVAHLAAIAAVTQAGQDPNGAFAVNLSGALHVIEAIRGSAPEAVLLHVSSAEVYGRSLAQAGGRPVDERALLQPTNVYAASKAAADLLVQATAVQGLRAIVARPFNHVGEGQSQAFVVPAFAAQIARAEVGAQPPVIEVGGLDDARDFLAVDDVVEAYLLLLARAPDPGEAEIFNIASGAAVTIAEVLARLMRLSTMALEVRIDPGRLRREPPAAHVGDASRLSRATGWRPHRELDAVLAAVLEEQRARVSEAAR